MTLVKTKVKICSLVDEEVLLLCGSPLERGLS